MWLTDTGSDILVSLDTVSLFATVPVEEVLEIIRNKLLEDDKLAECLILQVDAIIVLLEMCQKTMNFQLTGSSTKREHGYGELSVSSDNRTFWKPSALCGRTESITVALICSWCIAIWPLGLDSSKEFFNHINSWKPAIKYTMQAETASAILFLNVISHQERIYNGHQSLQKTHTHWPLSSFPIESPTTCEKRSCA